MNIIGYNMMVGMVFMGFLNYLHCYFGEHTVKDAKFELGKMDLFIYDKYYDEDVASF